jgi:hypothetical protein
MWLNIWAVSIAVAIGLAVMAIVMQSRNVHTALGSS